MEKSIVYPEIRKIVAARDDIDTMGDPDNVTHVSQCVSCAGFVARREGEELNKLLRVVNSDASKSAIVKAACQAAP